MELEPDIDVENDFLLNDNVKSINDLKMMNSERVLHEIIETLSVFKLDLSDMTYVMTDNCSKAQGSKTGVSIRSKEVDGNLIDLPGCSWHNIHLPSNDEIKYDSQGILKTFILFLNFSLIL